MPRVFCSLVLFCTTFLVAPPTASAAPITVPASLSPGSQYRLVFVTSTTRDANSTNIADYNTFVTNAANSVPQLVALGTPWKAIGSTLTDAARDNTGTNPGVNFPDVPLYSLDGSIVANDNADFWDGSHLAGINRNESGDFSVDNAVWTGTSTSGTAAINQYLGSVIIPFIAIGAPYDSNANWTSAAGVDHNELHYLYGMSGVLTVVPEPGSIVLACLTAAGLAVTSVRRRRLGHPS